jgi:hypothetical protein
VIRITVREHLGLAGQTAKGARMDDTGAVTLKGRAVRVRRLRVLALGQSAVTRDGTGWR